MSGMPLTNEQKLDEIYHIVKTQERHRLQASVARIAKWVIILSIVGFVASNPKFIIERVTEYVKPIVMEQVETMTKDLNDKLMQSAKDLVPAR